MYPVSSWLRTSLNPNNPLYGFGPKACTLTNPIHEPSYLAAGLLKLSWRCEQSVLELHGEAPQLHQRWFLPHLPWRCQPRKLKEGQAFRHLFSGARSQQSCGLKAKFTQVCFIRTECMTVCVLLSKSRYGVLIKAICLLCILTLA